MYVRCMRSLDAVCTSDGAGWVPQEAHQPKVHALSLTHYTTSARTKSDIFRLSPPERHPPTGRVTVPG